MKKPEGSSCPLLLKQKPQLRPSDEMADGLETHQIEGTTVQVTNIPKTIADCFKFRNKIGLEVALEALKDARQEKQVTMDELWRYAQLCREQNMMRPYLEGLAT